MAVAGSAPVEKMFTSTRPGRSVAERFVAGDTLESAVGVAKSLNEQGFSVSLDLLGEEVHDAASARAAIDEYLQCLDTIEAECLDANVSVKPTQLGLAIDEQLAWDAIDRLGHRAADVGTTVTIDMEDSRYTESTIRLFERAQSESSNFGVAVQAYMRRTPADLERVMPLGGHIRLCKGAYVESEDVAFTAKPDVDRAFTELLETLMAATSTKPAIATHDLALVDLARSLAEERNGPYEFQMLYGVRKDLQRSLVTDGYPVRLYLPFGSQWYPYLTRRMGERPSNLWFFVRALFSGG